MNLTDEQLKQLRDAGLITEWTYRVALCNHPSYAELRAIERAACDEAARQLVMQCGPTLSPF